MNVKKTVLSVQKTEEAPAMAAKAFCPQCGKEHEVGAKFCGGCGHKLA